MPTRSRTITFRKLVYHELRLVLKRRALSPPKRKCTRQVSAAMLHGTFLKNDWENVEGAGDFGGRFEAPEECLWKKMIFVGYIYMPKFIDLTPS